jgi:hypothetical protein
MHSDKHWKRVAKPNQQVTVFRSISAFEKKTFYAEANRGEYQNGNWQKHEIHT